MAFTQEFITSPRKAIINRFDDVADFVAVCESDSWIEDRFSDSEWAGGMSYEQAIHACKSGYLPAVEQAEKLLYQINASGIELPRRQWGRDVAGAFPIVPAFLAGEPDCMATMQEHMSEQTPIRIYAGMVSPAGLKVEQLTKRSVAILALTMLLSSVRPIELYVYMELGDRSGAFTNLIRINSAPLDLSVAGFILGHQSFVRGLNYAHAKAKANWIGGWAWEMHESAERIGAFRTLFNAAPSDIVLAAPYLDDDIIINNPIAWINNQLAEIAKNDAGN